MPETILTAKLYMPAARPELVRRPRLEALLERGLQARLVLVSAPPGFGKTTALSAWIQRRQEEGGGSERRAFAWLSLDESDNDPARFFSYVSAALGAVAPGFGQGLAGRLAATPTAGTQPASGSEMAAALLNDIAALPAPVALVLDDYHLIQQAEIHAGLQSWLERAAGPLCVVITTRQDPPLALPRLRVRDELVEIRERELRFTGEEAATYLNQVQGLGLSGKAVATLEERTEGWIAGLKMAALSLRDREDPEAFITAFSGSDRYLMDYLVEEVLSRQTEAVQSFLLKTSILERLCADLCEAVTAAGEPASGQPTGAEVLEYLDRANLFLVPLDNQREWYRYHHLFAELLHYRLKRAAAEQIPELHRRASRWFLQNGSLEAALAHALAIPDLELAARLAERGSIEMIGASQLAAFLSWTKRLPVEVIRPRAQLCAGCGWAYLLTGQVDTAEEYVRMGEAALADFERHYPAPDGWTVSKEYVAGQLATIRSYAARLRGQYETAIQQADKALEHLSMEALNVRCVVALNLGLLRLELADIAGARQALSEAFTAAQKSGENAYVAVSAAALLGEIALSCGRLSEGEQFFIQGLQAGRLPAGKNARAVTAWAEADLNEERWAEPAASGSAIPAASLAHIGLAEIHFLRGEMQACHSHLEKCLALSEGIGSAEILASLELLQANLKLADGELEQAEEHLERAERLSASESNQAAHHFGCLSGRAELLLAQGQPEQAAALLAAAGFGVEGFGGENLRPGEARPPSRRGAWAPAVVGGPAVSGGPTGTRGAAEAGERHAKGQHSQWWRSLQPWILAGRARLALGEASEAARLLEGTAERAARQGLEANRVEALVFAAAAWRQAGHPGRAVSCLRAAAALAGRERLLRPFLQAGEAAVQALRQAALQEVPPGEAAALLRRVEALSAGQPTAQRAAQLPGETEADPLTALTGRERQVLRCLAAGLSSNQMAEQLMISVSTARSYIKSLYQKLGAHSRAEAIEIGRQRGLI